MHPLIHSPNICSSGGVSQTKARDLELSVGLPHRWQVFRGVGHRLLPPRECISRELELQAERGLTSGTLTLDVTAKW